MQFQMRLARGSPRLHSTPHIVTSPTLDIREILQDAGDLPNLLNEEPIFDSRSILPDIPRSAPPFPASSHRPPIFLVHSHRAQLPFALHANALALGDICPDEDDARIILTAPTVPRMKLVIKEHLFVQKWVNTIRAYHVPNHVPWTCDKPVAERKWIAEGFIFPAGALDSFRNHYRTECTASIFKNAHSSSQRLRPVLCAIPQVLTTNKDSKRDMRAVSQTPSKLLNSESANRARRMRVRHDIQSADVVSSPNTSGVVTTTTSRRSIAVSSPGVNETIVSTPNQPLAARRGKMVHTLQLKDDQALKELDYPDIPTAFRGSPSVWVSRFELQPLGHGFTGHRNMLASLQSRCVALSGGLSTPECPEIKDAAHSHTFSNSTSSDDWEFSKDLASFEDDYAGGYVGPSVSSQAPHRSSRSESFGNCQDHIPIPPNAQALEPPSTSLPPRPAMVNPAAPPHVRSILKKSKTVHFEDHLDADDWEYDAPLVPPPLAGVGALSRPSPLRHSFTVNSEPRSSTPTPFNAKEVTSGPEKEPEVDGAPSYAKNTRLMPPLPKGSGRPRNRLTAITPATGSKSSNSQPAPAVLGSLVTSGQGQEGSDRDKRADACVAKAPRNQRWSSPSATDLRKGIEGASKGRLPTPLRNIFRFK